MLSQDVCLERNCDSSDEKFYAMELSIVSVLFLVLDNSVDHLEVQLCDFVGVLSTLQLERAKEAKHCDYTPMQLKVARQVAQQQRILPRDALKCHQCPFEHVHLHRIRGVE